MTNPLNRNSLFFFLSLLALLASSSSRAEKNREYFCGSLYIRIDFDDGHRNLDGTPFQHMHVSKNGEEIAKSCLRTGDVVGGEKTKMTKQLVKEIADCLKKNKAVEHLKKLLPKLGIAQHIFNGKVFAACANGAGRLANATASLGARAMRFLGPLLKVAESTPIGIIADVLINPGVAGGDGDELIDCNQTAASWAQQIALLGQMLENQDRNACVVQCGFNENGQPLSPDDLSELQRYLQNLRKSINRLSAEIEREFKRPGTCRGNTGENIPIVKQFYQNLLAQQPICSCGPTFAPTASVSYPEKCTASTDSDFDYFGAVDALNDAGAIACLAEAPMPSVTPTPPPMSPNSISMGMHCGQGDGSRDLVRDSRANYLTYTPAYETCSQCCASETFSDGSRLTLPWDIHYCMYNCNTRCRELGKSCSSGQSPAYPNLPPSPSPTPVPTPLPTPVPPPIDPDASAMGNHCGQGDGVNHLVRDQKGNYLTYTPRYDSCALCCAGEGFSDGSRLTNPALVSQCMNRCVARCQELGRTCLP